MRELRVEILEQRNLGKEGRSRPYNSKEDMKGERQCGPQLPESQLLND